LVENGAPTPRPLSQLTIIDKTLPPLCVHRSSHTFMFSKIAFKSVGYRQALAAQKLLFLFQKFKSCTSSLLKLMSVFFIKSRLDATILTGIIFKGAANFELKFFQVDIMALTEF
jgi:hypothetical protein